MNKLGLFVKRQFLKELCYKADPAIVKYVNTSTCAANEVAWLLQTSYVCGS